MTPLDAALVRRKLRRIRLNLETVAKLVGGLTSDAYATNEVVRRATERLLQETIDAAVDANNHLLRGSGIATPEDYYRSFLELGRAGVIAPALAAELAPAAGLRNRIVHEYEELDHALILKAAQDAPARFRAYLDAVEQHLTSKGL